LARPAPALLEGAVSGPDVVWQQLSTKDVEKARADYGALFGWHFEAAHDLGDGLGISHPFAWQPGAVAIGGMSDIVSRPGVHAHWLFHFRVPALEPALAEVGSRGGSSLGPFSLPNGDRVAVCDDPQGAAFALLARPA
jgi:uncharacterized protein